MNFKKILTTVLTLTLVTTSIIGCKTTKTNNELKEINLTYVKAPLNVPSILQKNDNLFSNEFADDGIAVNFHEITSGPDQTQALAAGELDFLHALGGTSALIAASNGVELEILNTYSRSPKGFMILAKKEAITSVKDLVGKKIAGPKGTILHQVLIASLQSEGCSIEDVEFINMGIADAATALEDGSVDAALIAGPTALKSINSGSRIIANGEGLVDGIIVTAVSKEFAEKNPEIVKRFLKVEEETLDYIKLNYEETMEKVANEVGLTIEETKEMYAWYDFSLEITDADVKSLEQTQEFLIQNGLQETKVDVKELLYK